MMQSLSDVNVSEVLSRMFVNTNPVVPEPETKPRLICEQHSTSLNTWPLHMKREPTTFGRSVTW